MKKVNVFSKLNNTPENHKTVIESEQPDHLKVAEQMAKEICVEPFENQNQMLLRIQEYLISDRTAIVEYMENKLYSTQAELENARQALHSIMG